jgi:hypothetical protein
VLVAAAIVVPRRSVHAQALEPRSYANTPVGINFVLLGYGYTQGDVGFDASSPIEDAKVHVHAGLLAYARSLTIDGEARIEVASDVRSLILVSGLSSVPEDLRPEAPCATDRSPRLTKVRGYLGPFYGTQTRLKGTEECSTWDR